MSWIFGKKYEEKTFQSPDVFSASSIEGEQAAQNRQAFLSEIAKRILEKTGRRSQELDQVINLLESSQSRRTYDQNEEAISFFEQIFRLNPTVAKTIKQAHDDMVGTLNKTDSEKFGPYFTMLEQPGSITSGYDIHIAITNILHKR